MKHTALPCVESEAAFCLLDSFLSEFEIPSLKLSFSHVGDCSSLYQSPKQVIVRPWGWSRAAWTEVGSVRWAGEGDLGTLLGSCLWILAPAWFKDRPRGEESPASGVIAQSWGWGWGCLALEGLWAGKELMGYLGIVFLTVGCQRRQCLLSTSLLGTSKWQKGSGERGDRRRKGGQAGPCSSV